MNKKIIVSFIALVLLGLFIYLAFIQIPLDKNNTIDDECNSEPEIVKGLAIKHPRNNCYFDKAIEYKNKNYCNKISGDKLKVLECNYKVASAKGDPSLCDDIKKDIQNDIYRNNCYKDSAINNKDGKICLLIQDTASKNYCLEKVGIMTKDKNVCEMIPTSSAFRTNCLNKIQKTE